MVPFVSDLVNYLSRVGSLKQNRCQIEFSRIFKDSLQLEQLIKSDMKGNKISVI